MYHSLIDIDLLEKGLHEKETPDRHRGFRFTAHTWYTVTSFVPALYHILKKITSIHAKDKHSEADASLANIFST